MTAQITSIEEAKTLISLHAKKILASIDNIEELDHSQARMVFLEKLIKASYRVNYLLGEIKRELQQSDSRRNQSSHQEPVRGMRTGTAVSLSGDKVGESASVQTLEDSSGQFRGSTEGPA